MTAIKGQTDAEILDMIEAEHGDDLAVAACIAELRAAPEDMEPAAKMALVKKLGYAVSTKPEPPVATPLAYAMSQRVH